MAIPWQTDTASCRAGYDKSYDPYLPTFWPARVPNQVLSETAYQIVMDTALPLSERLAAFANRASWLEPLDLDKSYTYQINHMIHYFDQMGVVEVRPGLPDDPNFPGEMQVSDQLETSAWRTDNVLQPAEKTADSDVEARRIAKRLTLRTADRSGEALADSGPTDLTQIEKVNRVPHGLTKR
jgi:hypothetical protein